MDPDLWQLLHDGGSLMLLSLALVGIHRRWWVPGWLYRAAQGRADRWEQRVRRSWVRPSRSRRSGRSHRAGVEPAGLLHGNGGSTSPAGRERYPRRARSARRQVGRGRGNLAA
jgi:hypothetical protein